MSAFLVSNETINAVVHALMPIETPHAQNQDELGRRLQAMNARAILERYGEEDEPLPCRWSPRNYSNIEMYKACQCLQYQCTEGDVPDCDLYKQLSTAIDSLAREIVSNLDEYNSAPWDRPERQACIA